MEEIIVKEIPKCYRKGKPEGIGSFSNVIKNRNGQTCTKIYNNYADSELRYFIRKNYNSLSKNSSLVNNPNFILPDILYLDENGNVIASVMKFLPYISLLNFYFKFYLRPKYQEGVSNVLEKLMQLKDTGIILFDLRNLNILMDHNGVPYFIDNDFSVLNYEKELLEEITRIGNWFYMGYYRAYFSKDLAQYNDYKILLLLSELLISTKALVQAYKAFKDPYAMMDEINAAIQTDKDISDNFKKEIANIINRSWIPSISQDTIDDYKEILQRKIAKKDN